MLVHTYQNIVTKYTQMAKFMGPIWGPSGADNIAIRVWQRKSGCSAIMLLKLLPYLPGPNELTHLPLVPNICVDELSENSASIGLGNGLTPVWPMLLTHWGWDKMATISQMTLLKWIFFNENYSILLYISLKFVPTVRINNILALVQAASHMRHSASMSYGFH